MNHDDRRAAGFKDRTRLPAARARLRDAVAPVERTEGVPLADAVGRAVAGEVTAPRAVPHYARAAMDGYAVRASDTFGASDRSPVPLRVGDSVGPDRTVRVHTGSELPAGADAVVMIEDVERERSDDVAVFDAVAEGENVAPVGEDVAAGQSLYDRGHRLRPSDLGLLRAVGLTEVEVIERPRVSVLPTGEEVVDADPGPGEVVDTNGQTVSQYVRRWGGEPTHRDVVTDDRDALAVAIREATDHDVVVTTGGSSVGERDLVPEVVDELGEVLVHGVALKPGHPVALGRVSGTPVVMLPGYPVACIVNAVQFLRPAVKRAGGLPVPEHPTTRATLDRKVASEPGTRTFVRVRLEAGETGPRAVPTRASGSGVLSSVALADGWVVVPDDREGIPAGETVAVQDWEWSP